MNPIKLLSKYRSQLMGLAILWIVFYHAHLQNHLFFPFNFIFEIGYGGVDVFLFLSGFGLYYSSLKEEKLGRFYLKRFARIYPAFLIIVFLRWIYDGNESVADLFLQFTTLDFWLYARAKYWYVSAIVIFYLTFPLYIKFFNKNKILTTVLLTLFGIGLTLFIYWLKGATGWILFSSRIAIFHIGIYFGYLSLKDKPGNKWLLYVLSLLGMVILMYMTYKARWLLLGGGHWLPFILIVPGLLLFLSELFEKTLKWKPLNIILTFIGGFTLELYLLNQPFLDLKNIIPGIDHRIAILLLIFISIVFAYLLSIVSEYLAKLILKE